MKCSDYDVILLVIASRGGCACGQCGCCNRGHRNTTEYDEFVRVYWSRFIRYLKDHTHRVKVFLVYGSDDVSDLPLREEDVLRHEDAREGLGEGITQKTMWALGHVLKQFEFRHVVRTNLSSFFVLEHLINTSRTLDATGTYAGVDTRDACNHAYIAGSSIWMSADVANTLVLRCALNADGPDDVSIGVALEDTPRKRLPCMAVTKPRKFCIIDYADNSELYVWSGTPPRSVKSKWETFKDVGELVKCIMDTQSYHIRLKNEVDRGVDISIATYLTDRLYPDAAPCQHIDDPGDLLQDPELSSLYAASR